MLCWWQRDAISNVVAYCGSWVKPLRTLRKPTTFGIQFGVWNTFVANKIFINVRYICFLLLGVHTCKKAYFCRILKCGDFIDKKTHKNDLKNYRTLQITVFPSVKLFGTFLLLLQPLKLGLLQVMPHLRLYFTCCSQSCLKKNPTKSQSHI